MPDGLVGNRGAERLRRTLIGLAALAIALLLARALADVLLLVFAAALIAAVLRGAANRVGRALRLPIGAALLLLLVGGVGILIAAIFWRGPDLVAEVVRLSGQLGTETDRVRDALRGEPWAARAVSRVQDYLNGGHFTGLLSGFASGTVGALASFTVMAVAALYFAVAPKTYVEGALRLVAIRRRDRTRAIVLALGHTLRWWFVGQAVDMLAVGTLTTIGLLVLGVPLALTLGIIAALFNFVPYIGAICGAVPAVLVAFGLGPEHALGVAVLFVAVQTLEGNVIAPLIQRRTVELPPVLTIFSQTVLGTLFGPLGLILATPLTAAGMVLVRMAYVEDVLGDRAPPPR